MTSTTSSSKSSRRVQCSTHTHLIRSSRHWLRSKMHHLHPRSRTTSTLFTTTLAVSFLVVTLPHLLPCPVDRRQFADTIEGPDGKPRRRRRPIKDSDGDPSLTNGNGEDLETIKRKRECPVPKPGGFVGQMMGFEKEEGKKGPVEVVVKGLDGRSLRREGRREGNGDGNGAP